MKSTPKLKVKVNTTYNYFPAHVMSLFFLLTAGSRWMWTRFGRSYTKQLAVKVGGSRNSEGLQTRHRAGIRDPN